MICGQKGIRQLYLSYFQDLQPLYVSLSKRVSHLTGFGVFPLASSELGLCVMHTVEGDVIARQRPLCVNHRSFYVNLSLSLLFERQNLSNPEISFGSCQLVTKQDLNQGRPVSTHVVERPSTELTG